MVSGESHDVFVSYASGDKVVADQVCAALDSPPGKCLVAKPAAVRPASGPRVGVRSSADR